MVAWGCWEWEKEWAVVGGLGDERKRWGGGGFGWVTGRGGAVVAGLGGEKGERGGGGGMGNGKGGLLRGCI